jgi:hypothetical protein
MFTPKNKKSQSAKDSYLVERMALFASIFFLAFGMGLITDGKKLYQNQLKLSQRVDFKATLNPYQN